jgi:hypothetical protein
VEYSRANGGAVIISVSGASVEFPALLQRQRGNFLDGRASFRELRGCTGGHEISRSSEDRWLMDFLRAHHDAQLMGASTLREEPGRDARGWDFGIDDEELRSYRRETLKLASKPSSF